MKTFDQFIAEAYNEPKMNKSVGGNTYEVTHHTKNEIGTDSRGNKHFELKRMLVTGSKSEAIKKAKEVTKTTGDHADVYHRERHQVIFPVSPGLSESLNNPKDPATMSAAELNKELDRHDKRGSELTDQLIAAGRGHERHSEIVHPSKTDPLSMAYRAHNDRHGDLRNEVKRRVGPNGPSRLPRGFGPIKGIGR